MKHCCMKHCDSAGLKPTPSNGKTRTLLILGAFVLVVATSSIDGARPPARQTDTKLVVILVIDQMRFDYLDRFSSLWTSGLKRLREQAAVFERAFYPYLNTVTCVGHATIATGAFPSTHGIILNEWYQRAAGRRMSCTDDGAVKALPYSGTADRIGHSSHRLRVPTLAERLRAQSPESRVVALSMKPRSTVMLVGGAGDAVTWFGDGNAWSTSSSFTSTLVPEVQRFVADNPVDDDRPIVWERVHPASRYRGNDNDAAERPRAAWTSQFPHPLAGREGTAAGEFYNLWERSPFADAYLGRMAADQVRSLRLGQRNAVDFLGVSFSGLDYVGHDFGPHSHEVQDTLVRLDQTLGTFFAALDSAVGRDRYVVALSADHGVAEVPERVRRAGGDAGRVLNVDVRQVAEDAMVAAHGGGPHVAHVEYTNLYLTEGTQQRAAGDPKTLQPLLDAVGRMKGVLRVMPAAGLEKKRDSTDPVVRAAAYSHVPGESGDVIVVLKPNWIGTESSTATHGSMQPYDQHVPVILMGAPFRAGRYRQSATPADMAPTLAHVIGVPMPNAEGKVLSVALKK